MYTKRRSQFQILESRRNVQACKKHRISCYNQLLRIQSISCPFRFNSPADLRSLRRIPVGTYDTPKRWHTRHGGTFRALPTMHPRPHLTRKGSRYRDRILRDPKCGNSLFIGFVAQRSAFHPFRAVSDLSKWSLPTLLS